MSQGLLARSQAQRARLSLHADSDGRGDGSTNQNRLGQGVAGLHADGCLRKSGIVLLGVLFVRALLLGIYNRPRICGNSQMPRWGGVFTGESWESANLLRSVLDPAYAKSAQDSQNTCLCCLEEFEALPAAPSNPAFDMSYHQVLWIVGPSCGWTWDSL